ncbi:uncharacterized protein [Clytia hemisphaerica]|uniref:uncharacterized protein n=1 Tax=Clytia hemisphaerica TaxID=252671 RepID=UPI0034D5D2AB
MADEREDVIGKSIKKILGKIDICLKLQQSRAVRNIVAEKDTLCVLPCGYGKSLIFQILPALLTELGHCSNPLVIIAVPLKSLIESHLKSALKFALLGIKATCLSSGNYNDIASGKYNLIFGCAELWLKKQWRELLSTKLFRKNLVCFVLDEAHNVTWGRADKKSKVPFRKAFGEISVIRSCCRPGTPMLALSATVNVDLTEMIKESCNLSRNFKFICDENNVSHLKQSVIKIKGKTIEPLRWLIQLLIDQKSNCPKTIIFCRTIELAGWMYERMENILKLHVPNWQNLIGMYHSETLPHKKKRVLDSLIDPHGAVRITVATSALGCGVDAKDLTNVISDQHTVLLTTVSR